MISYRGKVFRLRHSKGLAYIVHLVRHPGTEFHSAELMVSAPNKDPREEPEEITESGDRHMAETRLSDVNMHLGLPNHAGEMLDSKAKAAYRRRLVELNEELDIARKIGNSERGASLETEIDVLHQELRRAVGLGGRDRYAGSTSERARLSVTRAIKNAIQRISENDYELGALLGKTIRTGTFCSYVEDVRNKLG